MRALVQHLWHNDSKEIVNNTLVNCHTKGLHSIMLVNKPGQRIRMFVADATHDLWKNLPTNDPHQSAMSIGFHQHHCNVTLLPIRGKVVNVGFEADNSYRSRVLLTEFEYTSQILTGEQSFKSIGNRFYRIKAPFELTIGEVHGLPANEFHTIYVERDRSAAWFVLEGREWAEYKPICVSNADLENMKPDPEMYKKLNGDKPSEHLAVYNMLRWAFDGI